MADPRTVVEETALPKSESEVAPPQSAGASVTGAAVAAVEGVGAAIGRYRWVICALLFFATTINYIDRQVLGILAPTLQRELGWSETQYSAVVSWFTAAYALGFLGAGRLLDKVGTRIGYAIAITIWSLAAMAHSLARNAVQFS